MCLDHCHSDQVETGIVLVQHPSQFARLAAAFAKPCTAQFVVEKRAQGDCLLGTFLNTAFRPHTGGFGRLIGMLSSDAPPGPRILLWLLRCKLDARTKHGAPRGEPRDLKPLEASAAPQCLL